MFIVINRLLNGIVTIKNDRKHIPAAPTDHNALNYRSQNVDK